MQERWEVRNPSKLQDFDVGDCFYAEGEVLKIGFVSGISGVKSFSGNGHFFTIDDLGYVHKVRDTIKDLLDYYADKDIIYKLKANGIENGFVIYVPVYGGKDD